MPAYLKCVSTRLNELSAKKTTVSQRPTLLARSERSAAGSPITFTSGLYVGKKNESSGRVICGLHITQLVGIERRGPRVIRQ